MSFFFQNNLIIFTEYIYLNKTKVELPILTVLGNEIPKSKTIARYIARKLNLTGSTDLEQCETDAVVDTCIELLDSILDRVARKQQIELDDELRAHLDRLEKIVGLFGRNGFSVGTNLKWSDLAIYDTTSDLIEFAPKILDENNGYTNIKRIRTSVEANQRVAGYLKYRASAPFIVPEAL